jgi:hypothetical protein
MPTQLVKESNGLSIVVFSRTDIGKLMAKDILLIIAELMYLICFFLKFGQNTMLSSWLVLALSMFALKFGTLRPWQCSGSRRESLKLGVAMNVPEHGDCDRRDPSAPLEKSKTSQ